MCFAARVRFTRWGQFASNRQRFGTAIWQRHSNAGLSQSFAIERKARCCERASCFTFVAGQSSMHQNTDFECDCTFGYSFRYCNIISSEIEGVAARQTVVASLYAAVSLELHVINGLSLSQPSIPTQQSVLYNQAGSPTGLDWFAATCTHRRSALLCRRTCRTTCGSASSRLPARRPGEMLIPDTYILPALSVHACLHSVRQDVMRCR